MRQTKGTEEVKSETGWKLSNFLNMKRVSTLIKACALLAILFYLVHFVAQVIYLRNASTRLVSVPGIIAGAASGISFAFVCYAVGHIIGQAKDSTQSGLKDTLKGLLK